MVKIIQMDKISEKKVDTVSLSDGLVVDIEFENKNELLVIEDNKTIVIDEKLNIIEIEKINYNDIILVTIENDNNIILVKKNKNNIFDNSATMFIYDVNGSKKEFQLNSSPKQIYALDKVIAVDQGSQILFVSTNRKAYKKMRIKRGS
jgi:hypothetical protein